VFIRATDRSNAFSLNAVRHNGVDVTRDYRDYRY